MADSRARFVLRWLAVVASAIWLGTTIVLEFIQLDPTPYGFKSSDVEARMNTCGGSFQQRYECKEAIILAKQHESFLSWIEKAAIILGPPVLLGYLLRRLESQPRPRHPGRFLRPVSSLSKRRVR